MVVLKSILYLVAIFSLGVIGLAAWLNGQPWVVLAIIVFLVLGSVLRDKWTWSRAETARHARILAGESEHAAGQDEDTIPIADIEEERRCAPTTNRDDVL